MKKVLIALVAAISVLGARADEGMWMLNKIDQRTADVMKELGLQLTPMELYNPQGVSLKDAVVDFGDYCSGVVVSPEGLVFTNHHCGYGAIQKLSTPEDDILKNGFVARTREQERPAEGLFVRFLDRTEDCTGRIMRAMSGLEHTKLDSVMAAVEQEYREANPGMYCLVKSYYGDNAFYVSFYKTYTDIRLVFTATETLGKFGGETDNWMWPRQTCDFSVFRIYADKDGNPADYSADNVPLKSKRYAKVSLDGYLPGDYCMTIGYPGSTDRYLSSYGINQRVNGTNISMIQVRGLKQEVWKRHMEADRAVALKYASKYASSSNYWKNSIGMNKAVKDLNVIGLKQQLEQNIRLWYQNDADLTRRFGHMFQELEQCYMRRFQPVKAMGFFSETFLRGIELYRVANILSRMPNPRGEQDIKVAREQLETFYKDYDASLDQEVMATLLQNYREQVGADFLPGIYQEIDSLYNGDCKAYANYVYTKSILPRENSLDLLLADEAVLSTDPGIHYAQSITEMMYYFQSLGKQERENIDYNEHLLTQAILERDQQNAYYSDANFTMRLSYGYIQDYTSQGTHYDYYTTSKSLLEKAAKQNENADYKLEDDIVKLIEKGEFGRYADPHTRDLNLCFLSNNDITGGNSGSPMFNGKGELIGLAFDGNWEAMSGDISFDSDLQRCIGVDIRYVLFLIDKWGKADHIIRELGL